MKQVPVGMCTVLLLCSLLSQAQQSVATAANATVPPLIQFSNVATDEGGNTLSGVVSITFSLYSSQTGGEPLWAETQNNIPLDSTGHYSVQLGITKPTGVPTTLFTTGEARWLGAQIGQQAEQPRVLLLSVPYALKAGDAATIGGLPPSAFVLATPAAGSAIPAVAADAGSAPNSPPPPSGTITGTGTVNFLPLWDSTSDIISSVLFQSGSGNTAKVGINTTTPASTLDVKGGGTIRGTLSLPTAGTATATKGFNSQPLTLAASAFNSSTSKAANQTFQWQAEPAGNDTSAPSGTLNLLFGEGTAKPAETGLNIASNGQITFAQGQIFPGTGDGTVTSVGAGPGLSGGPITGSGTLSIPTAGVVNAMLANSSLTLTAGTDLTGGGLTTLGGNVTLNLDTTKVPQLNTANTFSGTQTVNNTVTMTGTNTSGVLQVTNTVTSGHGPAIVGTADSTDASGVKGVALATTGAVNGVYGTTSSTQGYGMQGTSPNVGVYGQAAGASVTGASEGFDVGVWGDTGDATGSYNAILGTADGTSAGAFINNSSAVTLFAENDSTDQETVFETYGRNFTGICQIDTLGNLTCNGTITGSVKVDAGARKVALYAMQSPENWFEDAGSGQLSNGSTRIELDPIFAQTVNAGVVYHVFLTAKGDSEGLYVSNETPQGFEVHEQRGGHSNVAFDYRIMAKRVGYENVRLADLTEQFNKQEAQHNRMRRPARPSAAPQAGPATPHSPLRTAAQPLTAHPK